MWSAKSGIPKSSWNYLSLTYQGILVAKRIHLDCGTCIFCPWVWEANLHVAHAQCSASWGWNPKPKSRHECRVRLIVDGPLCPWSSSSLYPKRVGTRNKELFMNLQFRRCAGTCWSIDWLIDWLIMMGWDWRLRTAPITGLLFILRVNVSEDPWSENFAYSLSLIRQRNHLLAVKSYDMGSPALLPMRRNVCCGFLSLL
jgi:hypothetical protein